MIFGIPNIGKAVFFRDELSAEILLIWIYIIYTKSYICYKKFEIFFNPTMRLSLIYLFGFMWLVSIFGNINDPSIYSSHLFQFTMVINLII